jgi:RNA polymerase sigma-70 factor (ECF subfamily)
MSLPRVNSLEHMSDAYSSRLIAECMAGNELAIETLVRQFEAGVYRLALSVLDDPAEASEVTQETFLSALRALPSYQERSSLRAWLYRIALNHSRSRLRKRSITERLHATLTAVLHMEIQKQLLPEETAIRNEQEAVLWQSLKELDERHRIVVILRYFHELPIAEIAQILSINEGTIHSRLHKARQKLRDALKHLQEE